MRIISIVFLTLYSFPYLGILSAAGKEGFRFDQMDVPVLPGLEKRGASLDSTLNALLTVIGAPKPSAERAQDAFVEVFAGVFSEIAGPLALVLPVLQFIMNDQDDRFQKMQKNIQAAIEQSFSKTEYIRAHDLVRAINRDIKRFRMLFDSLNETIRTRDGNAKAVTLRSVIGTSIVSIIQSDIEERVTEMSEGDSIFWKYPDMAAPTLFALSSFIALFTPIRDLMYGYVMDNSIISCIMAENIKAYLPSIVYWRLDQVTMPPVHKAMGYAHRFAYADNNSDTTTQREYELSTKGNHVNCQTELFKKDAKFITDGINGKKFYSEPSGGFYERCYKDYLAMLRWKTEKLFNDAKGMMDKTCSEKQRNRERTPTGE